MPLYAYVALAENGTALAGESVAASEQALRVELSGRGLLVQQVRAKKGLWPLRPRRIRPEDFALFNQEFMALLRAGLTVPDALALAAERPDSPAFAAMLARVNDDVRNGLALSAACGCHPEAFDRLYLAAVRTGEKTGDLAAVLARYQEYLRHRVALRKKLSQALAYPAVLLAALVVILGLLFLFVMPRFVSMYADLGAALPYPTRVLLGIVDHLYIAAPALIALAALAVWFARRSLARDTARRRLHRLLERLPYWGPLTRIVVAAQLARSLATLLGAGTPLVEAMRTAGAALDNRLYLDRLERATERVTEGGSLAQAVRDAALLPAMAARMIEVGEASGGLDAMLGEVAQFYEQALEHRLARVMALVEPLLMLLMGVLVGAIIIVMYLPVFHMADIIK
jgi:type IV pilus assembly protein PilC